MYDYRGCMSFNSMDTVFATDILIPVYGNPFPAHSNPFQVFGNPPYGFRTVSLRGFFRRCIALFAAFVSGVDDSDVDRCQHRFLEAERQYGTMIDRICFGYSRTKADFDDLKQEVLMNLWESMPKFKGDCSMKTWVYRLALNVCITSLRKSYLRVSTVQLTELYDIVDYDPDRKEALSELHEAIGTLNPLDKAIMILWLEEESYDGIAKITGLSRANVAVRIHRAKEKLKTMI